MKSMCTSFGEECNFYGTIRSIYNEQVIFSLHTCASWPLRFMNGGVLRNLNMYSSKKFYPVCSATWFNMKCVGQWEVPQQAGHLSN